MITIRLDDRDLNIDGEYDVCIGATIDYDHLCMEDQIMCPSCDLILVTISPALYRWIEDNFPPQGYGYQSTPAKEFKCGCGKSTTIVFGDYCG